MSEELMDISQSPCHLFYSPLSRFDFHFVCVPIAFHPGSICNLRSIYVPSVFRVPDPVFWVLDSGSTILEPRSRILEPGSASWIQDLGSWLVDPGSRIQDPGSWILAPSSRTLHPGSRIAIHDPEPSSRSKGT